jgi:uncharacterized membrane protein (DUF106 family)
MQMLSLMNNGIGAVLDGVLRFVDGVSPFLSIVVVSVAVGIALLLVFKLMSNQARIDQTKRSMQASLFEIRLFGDNPRAIVRAQVDIFKRTLAYLRYSSIPILWTIVPLVILTAHLQSRYGYRGVHVGEGALVKVHVKAGAEETASAITLDAPPGVRVDTPALWIPALHEVAWRVVGEREGAYALVVSTGGREFSKSLVVSERVQRRSPERLEAGLINQLLYPSESPLPSEAPMTSISVEYGAGYVSILGWESNWLVAFLIVSFAAAFAFKKRLKVTF